MIFLTTSIFLNKKETFLNHNKTYYPIFQKYIPFLKIFKKFKMVFAGTAINQCPINNRTIR